MGHIQTPQLFPKYPLGSRAVAELQFPTPERGGGGRDPVNWDRGTRMSRHCGSRLCVLGQPETKKILHSRKAFSVSLTALVPSSPREAWGPARLSLLTDEESEVGALRGWYQTMLTRFRRCRWPVLVSGSRLSVAVAARRTATKNTVLCD